MNDLLVLPEDCPDRRWTQVLWLVLLGYALTLPITIVLAEPLAFLAFPIGAYVLWRQEPRACRGFPYAWPLCLFALLATLSVLWSVRPMASVEKLHRLLLLPLVCILPAALAWDRKSAVSRLWILVGVFLVGSSILGLYDAVRVPVQVALGAELFHTGNMRDPQIYMVALCFFVAALAVFKEKPIRLWVLAGFLINLLGLVLHFKRGVWFACITALGIMAFAAGKKRWLLAIVVVAASLLLVPQVRGRLVLLKDVFSPELGGRYVLWTHVAPELLRQYPQGMGWSAVEHEDFSALGMYVQPKLDHLHNNLLHVTLELGWAGLAIWLGWMFIAGRLLWREATRCPHRCQGAGWLAAGALGAFAGLMLNGLVEYNFGDTEILMLLCLIMGVSAVLWMVSSETVGRDLKTD